MLRFEQYSAVITVYNLLDPAALSAFLQCPSVVTPHRRLSCSSASGLQLVKEPQESWLKEAEVPHLVWWGPGHSQSLVTSEWKRLEGYGGLEFHFSGNLGSQVAIMKPPQDKKRNLLGSVINRH